MTFTSEQRTGARFLAARPVAMLADRAGYGKTAQVVRACELVGARQVTVICPPILKPNEVRQFELWSLFGFACTILHTGKDKVPADGVVVCSYDLARNPRIRRLLRERGCDVLFLDEAHRLKGPRSKTTTAVLGQAGIARGARHVWFVTGDPAPNNASEYFVFLKTCGTWHGSFDEFVARYCRVIQTSFGAKIIGDRDDTRPELLAMLQPHLLARDGVDPGRGPLTVDAIEIEGAAPDFSEIDPDTLSRIERAIEAGDWRALQEPSVSTVRRIIGAAKAAGIATLAATELEGGSRKMLIFMQHRNAVDIVAGRLEGYGVGIIDGRTSSKRAEEIISAFQPDATGGPRVAIIQWQALKEGRDLVGARRVLIGEPAWTPADNGQMIARAWRRGQTEHVHASYCYLRCPVDMALAKTLQRKARDGESLRSQLAVA